MTLYERIKHYLFTLCYLVLWVQFFLLAADPAALGLDSGSVDVLPIYDNARGIINSIYIATEWICYPVKIMYSVLHYFVPSIQSDWFPFVPTSAIGQLFQNWVEEVLPYPGARGFVLVITSVNFEEKLPGVISWFPLMMVFFLKVLNQFVDQIGDLLKNFIWNVLIEFSFTKRKQAAYQQALETRADALNKLNTEYKNLSKEATQLKTSVITDELTQLFNKRFFIQTMNETFEKAKKEQKTLTLVMLDIDHFKKLNDNYGHLMGDKVLSLVAGIAKQFTPQNCFCCRFGGEEFGIILPDKTCEEALEVANHIKREVPLIYFEDIPNLRVTISQGLAAVNFGSPLASGLNSFDQLIKLADDELYRAKINGRDQVCHNRID